MVTKMKNNKTNKNIKMAIMCLAISTLCVANVFAYNKVVRTESEVIIEGTATTTDRERNDLNLVSYEGDATPTSTNITSTQDADNVYIDYDVTYTSDVPYNSAITIGQNTVNGTVTGNLLQQKFPGTLFISDKDFSNGISINLTDIRVTTTQPTSVTKSNTLLTQIDGVETYNSDYTINPDNSITLNGDVNEYGQIMVGFELNNDTFKNVVGLNNALVGIKDYSNEIGFTCTITNESTTEWKYRFQGNITLPKNSDGTLKYEPKYLNLVVPTGVTKDIGGGENITKETTTSSATGGASQRNVIKQYIATGIKANAIDLSNYYSHNHNWVYTNLNNTSHKKKCSICNWEIIENHGNYVEGICTCGYQCTHSQMGEYTYDDATHTSTCQICGKNIIGAHSMHIEQVDGNDLNHKNSCSICAFSQYLPHNFGTYTITQEYHEATCGDCGYVLRNEHQYNSDGFCSVCGTPCLHRFTYTMINENEHKGVCSICNYETIEAHEEKIDQEWKDEEKHRFVCEVCKGVIREETHRHNDKEEIDEKTGKVVKREWSGKDDKDHFHICVVCGKDLERTPHEFTYSKIDDTKHLKICEECGYEHEEAHDTNCPYCFPKGGGGTRGGGGGGGGGGARTPNAKLPTQKTNTSVNKETNATTATNETIEWIIDNTTKARKLKFTNTGYEAILTFLTIVDSATNTNKVYFFNENGEMVNGWLTTADNSMYFFEDEMTNANGTMITNSWKKIDGYYYYFGGDGKMLRNTMTTDGYWVDENGKYINYN